MLLLTYLKCVPKYSITMLYIKFIVLEVLIVEVLKASTKLTQKVMSKGKMEKPEKQNG
jgi:predicted amidohydrolase